MAAKNSRKYFKPTPKSLKWGGRSTGTPFAIPYLALIPATVNGLIITEKSWSVSHIANGSTRLQPVCLLLGQTAGAAASLAIDLKLEPYQIPIKQLQLTLLNDPQAPPTLVPLFDLKPSNQYRAAIQYLILRGIIDFPPSGNFRPKEIITKTDWQKWLKKADLKNQQQLTKNEKLFTREQAAQELIKLLNWSVSDSSGQTIAKFPVQKYCANLQTGGNPEAFKLVKPKDIQGQFLIRQTPFSKTPVRTAAAITLDPEVYKYLKNSVPQDICFKGAYNHSGAWFLITEILQ